MWVIDFQIKFIKYNLVMRTWMKGWGTSDSTTKLGCDVNIKSIHEEEF